jgi:hypothetical protein
MIELRPFSKLGAAKHGWLKAKHHFPFGGYYDPERMGWGWWKLSAMFRYKTPKRDKIKLPTRDKSGAYDDEATIRNRRWIEEKF